MARPQGMTLEEFTAWQRAFPGICRVAHNTAIEHGWWEEPRNDGELIVLMHSELSEALEGLRSGTRAYVAEELADVIIRIADFSEARGIDVGAAVLRKMRANQKRPYRHGGKRF